MRKPISSRSAPFAVLALAALAASPLAATTVLRQDLSQLTAGSETVVHGEVVRRWSAWDDQQTAIWTHYEIEVAEAWKGAPGKTVTISEPGGEVDGVRMAVPGAPTYLIGEKVVVFAVRTPVGYLRTCGWGQGRYAVEPDGRVRPGMAPDSAVGAKGEGKAAEAPPGTLEALRSRVRALVVAQDAGAQGGGAR